MARVMHLDPDLAFIQKVKAAGGGDLKQCMQCATCSVTCKLTPEDRPFPRKEMILAQWGQRDILMADPDVWICHQCNDCSTKCPRLARPSDVLAALRAFAFRHYSFPGFMGQALASPLALPLLLIVPALVLLGILVQASQGDYAYLFAGSGEVDYAKAFPHGILEMLFMGGNALILAFATVGLFRFWKALQSNAPQGASVGFIAALMGVILEFLPHRKFNQCGENKPRLWGHLLMFYGFVGAMATAGLALFATVILKDLGSPVYLESPLNLPNPIKILGVASGLAMLIGSGLLISRRLASKDGSGGYQDWLFLIMITLVGLTGMLAWVLRLAQIPVAAYADYYLHLTLVFFLLWYAPYSKFGHMFYRTLALTFARCTGREPAKKQIAA